MAKIVELIITYETVGKGTKDDVARVVTKLWTKEGTQVAEYDAWKGDSWFMGNDIKTMEGEVSKIFS